MTTYFCDPKTNDREPNLLTEQALPKDNAKLVEMLAAQLRAVCLETPQVFAYVHWTLEMRALLSPADEKAKVTLKPSAVKQVRVKPPKRDIAAEIKLLQAIQRNDLDQLQRVLASLDKETRLPTVIIETAVAQTEPEIILALARSNACTVNLRMTQFLAERQQSQRIGPKRLKEILFELLRGSKAPNQRKNNVR